MLCLVALSVFSPRLTLNVFAAASLKESFSAIEKLYEAKYPNVDVRLNFAGSQTLATQISHGAPADVFASAAEKNLRSIRYDAKTFRFFASNHLIITLRRGLSGFSTPLDLARVGSVVVADPAVPVGAYTQAFFERAAKVYGAGWMKRVKSHVVSRELDVKAVLAKVILGEADAGVVYSTDSVAAGEKVGRIAIPNSMNEVVRYPVAVPLYAEHPAEGLSFVEFLLSKSGQTTLKRFGFGGRLSTAVKKG